MCSVLMRQCLSLILIWTEIRGITGASVFTLSSVIRSWYEAKARCEANGQRLAVLDTRKKIEEVLDQMNTYGGFPWIGFRYHSDRDAYLWENGEEVERDSTNWAAGLRLNGYGSLDRDGQWRDFHDGYSIQDKYVCERLVPDQEKKCLASMNTTGNGNSSDLLVDGSTDTCVIIPRSDECCNAEYSVIVNGSCIHDNTFNINVTMATGSTCDVMRSVMFVNKASHCDGRSNVKRGSRCEITSTDAINDKTTCLMRCECADSADQCLVHLYSGLNQVDVGICEMKFGN